jgi:hypothetical protein
VVGMTTTTKHILNYKSGGCNCEKWFEVQENNTVKVTTFTKNYNRPFCERVYFVPIKQAREIYKYFKKNAGGYINP